MGLKDGYNYVRGDIRAELDGMAPEKILNRLSAEGVEMWGIEPTERGTVKVSMSAKDYRALRPVVRRSGCRVKLISRRGLLYTARRLRKRMIVLAGFALIAALAFYMNSVILTIEVTGCEKLQPSEIIEAMERQGVGRFTRTKTVDASDLRNAILLDMPELIWFTVNFSGSRAMVDVRERDKPPEIAEKRGTADIFSDFNGVITKIQVYKGEAAVKENDVVQEGDLLVSGTVHLHTENIPMPVHASADIWARVWESRTAVMPLDVTGKIPTGRKKTRYSLILGRNRINFYKNSGNVFDNCDKITKRYILGEGMGLCLPVSLEVQHLYEVETCEKHLSGGGELLSETLRTEMLQTENTEILSQRVWEENGFLLVRVNSETERKIGVTVYRE